MRLCRPARLGLDFMEIVNNLDQLKGQPLALLIGNFDGVHLGHQSVIHQVLELAQGHQWIPAVLSFDPHPRKILAPGSAPRLIQTLEEKQALLAHHGIQIMINLPFTRELAQLEPRAFMDLLTASVSIRMLSVGQAFRFGLNRAGGVDDLRAWQNHYGYALFDLAEKVHDHGQIISSSRIRKEIELGHVREAAAMLGRPVFRIGKVGSNYRMGRRLGFPTANLQSSHECFPRFGVYASWLLVDGNFYSAITNVGQRPTFEGSGIQVESHLINHEIDLYDKRVALIFSDFHRPEQRFPDVDQLKLQIAADITWRQQLNDPAPEGLRFLQTLL
ncbi:MAG: riboflavin biosynthesis protein RibF [Acidobacteria bacterium]|nr:riboflavin biosynthesis protein RibF [Acidobacteriota bacterium]